MLFFDPKWGNGCLAIIVCTAGLYLLGAVMRHFDLTWEGPVGQVVGILLLLGIARFIVNQIFD